MPVQSCTNVVVKLSGRVQLAIFESLSQQPSQHPAVYADHQKLSAAFACATWTAFLEKLHITSLRLVLGSRLRSFMLLLDLL